VSRIVVGESLLLVVDAQDGFYPESRVDVDQAAKDAALSVAAWLCGVARVIGVPTVVTEEDAALNGPTAKGIANQLATKTPVHDKRVFGAADNPEIWQDIQASQRSTVVVVGMETDVCVAHSALGLKGRGLRPVVVQNAVFSAAAAHAYGLARLRQADVELLSAKEVFYDWRRDLASVVRFGEEHPELHDPPGFSL
jgi:nicotinamidase-related amidase